MFSIFLSFCRIISKPPDWIILFLPLQQIRLNNLLKIITILSWVRNPSRTCSDPQILIVIYFTSIIFGAFSSFSSHVLISLLLAAFVICILKITSKHFSFDLYNLWWLKFFDIGIFDDPALSNDKPEAANHSSVDRDVLILFTLKT